MSELRHKMLTGITWSTISRVVCQILAVTINVVLAHLLGPRDFGLMAMVVVVTAFAGVIVQLGLGHALVQHQNVRQEHLSSVFWFQIVTGLLLTLLLTAAAPLVARFYHEPALAPLTMLLSLDVLLTLM